MQQQQQQQHVSSHMLYMHVRPMCVCQHMNSASRLFILLSSDAHAYKQVLQLQCKVQLVATAAARQPRSGHVNCRLVRQHSSSAGAASTGRPNLLLPFFFEPLCRLQAAQLKLTAYSLLQPLLMPQAWIATSQVLLQQRLSTWLHMAGQLCREC
jgi:hypothetical protein